MIDLQKVLNEKIQKLDSRIEDVKFERDHSATPMESASDKSRQLAEQLMDALHDERKHLVSLKRKITNLKEISVYHLITPLGERQFAIVPDGLGGGSQNDISLLSDKTPLAKELATHQSGEVFVFNSQEITIKSIKKRGI